MRCAFFCCSVVIFFRYNYPRNAFIIVAWTTENCVSQQVVTTLVGHLYVTGFERANEWKSGRVRSSREQIQQTAQRPRPAQKGRGWQHER